MCTTKLQVKNRAVDLLRYFLDCAAIEMPAYNKIKDGLAIFFSFRLLFSCKTVLFT